MRLGTDRDSPDDGTPVLVFHSDWEVMQVGIHYEEMAHRGKPHQWVKTHLARPSGHAKTACRRHLLECMLHNAQGEGLAVAPDETVELVIKLHDHVEPKSTGHESIRSTLRDVGVQVDANKLSSGPDNYSSVIVPRGVASRAVEALKGNAAVEGAFVKPRGETP